MKKPQPSNSVIFLLKVLKRFVQGALVCSIPLFFVFSRVSLDYVDKTIICVWIYILGFMMEYVVSRALKMGTTGGLETSRDREDMLGRIVIAGMQDEKEETDPEKQLLTSLLAIVWRAKENDTMKYMYGVLTLDQVLGNIDPVLNKDVQKGREVYDKDIRDTFGKREDEDSKSSDNDDIAI